MKKAKLMLTAIGIFAVVGGAMAFKAHKFAALKVYQKNAAGTSCTFRGTYDPFVQGNPSITFTNATISASQPLLTACTTTVTVQAENL